MKQKILIQCNNSPSTTGGVESQLGYLIEKLNKYSIPYELDIGENKSKLTKKSAKDFSLIVLNNRNYDRLKYYKFFNIPIYVIMHYSWYETFTSIDGVKRVKDEYIKFYQEIVNQNNIKILCLTKEDRDMMVMMFNNDYQVHVAGNKLQCKTYTFSSTPANNVGWVGRISWDKGVFDLFTIAELCPELTFYVSDCYDQYEDYMYEDFINLVNKRSNIKLIPSDRVNEIYDNCHVLLCTSKCESFSLVIFEALMHGLKVVTYDYQTAPIYEYSKLTGDIAYCQNGDITTLKMMLRGMVHNKDTKSEVNSRYWDAYKKLFKYTWQDYIIEEVTYERD